MRSIRTIEPATRGRVRVGVLAGALSLVLAVWLSATTMAATYYVDNQSPNASPAGPGTEAWPYSTISSAVAARKGPGVTILVKPGVYREEISIPASGAQGDPYVLRATGPGVVVDGADDFSDPTRWIGSPVVPGNGSHGMASVVDGVWLAASVTYDVQQVFVDGARLERSAASPDALPINAFRWVAGQGLYVNLGGDSPTTRMTLVGVRQNGFKLSSRSWVIIDGFEITRSEDRGINIQNGCTDLVISNNRVSYTRDYGIKSVNGQRLLLDGNVVSYAATHGIGLTAGSYACVLRDNDSFRNAQPGVRAAKGIYLFEAPGNTLIGNRAYENQDTGIHFGTGSNNCISYNNQSWSNGDHGFDHLNASGTIHVNEVAYANYKDGFSIEGESPNTQIYNCISVINGINTDEFNLWVNGPSAVGFRSDHNIFWNPTAQPPVKYIATKFGTLAAYSAASGQDANSIQADPQFLNPSQGEFLPMSGSPAIDAGDSGAPYWPATDAAGHGRVDDLSISDLGVGPVSYGDIGALEFGGVDPPAIALPNPLGGMSDRMASSSTAGASLTAVSLSNGFPNPSHGEVEFALELPTDAQVVWEVFDLQGRVVWSEQRALAAGRTQMSWDGRTAGGGPAGSGIYLVRARVEDQQFTRRIILF